jgi:RNA polymerase sigma-70 factor, ECF subfamily
MLQASAIENEHRLVCQAQNGDRDAFGDLVCLYRLPVIQVVYRMCGDARLAEDAAQKAFIQAWLHLPGFRPHSSFRNWLYRIAVNAALDVLRREKPGLDIEQVDLPAQSEQMENRLEQGERLQTVRRAVLELPEASRAVLILREYEGFTYQEIAETLEIPLGTVMSRLNYARKCLLERLRMELEEV